MEKSSKDSELLLRLYLIGTDSIFVSDPKSHARSFSYVRLLSEGFVTAQDAAEHRIMAITDRGRDVVREALHGPRKKGTGH